MRTCVNGHEMTDENTYTDSEGRGTCRECRRASKRRHYGRNRERLIAESGERSKGKDRTAWYQENRERLKKVQEVRRSERRVLLRELKEGVPCMDCGGVFDPVCMDFDHRDPSTKSGNVGAMALSASWERVIAEIKKCDLVCSNCHRMRTYRV